MSKTLRDDRKMFYFLFIPKFSGSTIMSQTLANAVNGYLPPFTNNEGQMAPGVKKIIFAQDRWDPSVDYDWISIKHEWLSLLHQSKKNIFIEGSPPNLMRLASIQKHFSDQMRGVISISSPYLQISSAIKKKYQAMIAKDKLDPNSKIPKKLMKEAISFWVAMAKAQRNNIQANPSMPVVTYEQFCANPNILINAFSPNIDASTDQPLITKAKGKKYTGIGEIMDMTCKNLSFFSLKEISSLTKLLRPHKRLIHFFGYDLLSTKEIVSMYNQNLPLVIDGLHSRLHR